MKTFNARPQQQELHKMPAGLSHTQQVSWHARHKKECGCQKIPFYLQEEVEQWLHEDWLVDKASFDSFPASDPPSY